MEPVTAEWLLECGGERLDDTVFSYPTTRHPIRV